MFEKIKNYYNEGLWNEARVRNMLIRGIITEEQFNEIIYGNQNRENE